MKSNYLFALTIGFSLATALSASAQKQWSLKECIDFAVENNINIKKFELQTENQEIQLNTAKMSRLPNLNAGVNENFGFGRSADRDGVIRDNSSSNTGFNISSSVPLFTGMRIPNQIHALKFDLRAAMADLDKAKEDLALNVTSVYLDILFKKEILNIAQEQVKISIEQLHVSKAKFANGKSPESEVFEIEAELARNELNWVESNNNVILALLNLSQLLNIDNTTPFDIETPDLALVTTIEEQDINNPALIYAYSLQNRPAIQSAEFRLKSSQKSLHVAKSGYYPTINFNAGYSNNYYYNYKLPEGYTNSSFGDQLKTNGSESIGLSLSIPIFNRFSVRNHVKQARLNIESQKLELVLLQQNLFKEIEQAYLSAISSQKKLKAAEKLVYASRVAFDYEEKKFNSGRSTPWDLSNSRLRYERALSEETQARFDFVFRIKILDFYNGKTLYFD